MFFIRRWFVTNVLMASIITTWYLYGRDLLLASELNIMNDYMLSGFLLKWWALYKAQEVTGRILAVHLRGTVFLNYWFEMLGARVGSLVLLDTVDITDPTLVLIGNGAIITEGAMVQSHEVRDGVLSFMLVKIGQNVSIGPYSVIQKGSVLGDEAEVPRL
ncbi:uncharacterized protein LOC131219033 isoform X1 [Magnolia sinica]|uniref:uncharacterized protein LOC131219033 isoform X1 n=1 Tax=Magnolia sinica TaxID=86752 RepID=UPI0026597B68|nr:uncharacterized protein LOC131219033 isoform X1 [Magnolia sinica]XP_058069979.1 uncharacterized protein LOC131219033 isoform X1 [Magnolia sinica]XP_058069980.1 uncharacterized protein LOC131219033 isoform X1 [Magnolia sinica]